MSDFAVKSSITISSLVVPTLLGNLFSYIFIGILFVQIYLYQSHSSNDPKIVKSFVYGLLATEVLIVILTSVVAWIIYSAGWGNTSPLNTLKYISAVLPGLVGLATCSVHMFFCWRMWVLRRLSLLAGFIMALSLTSWGAAMTCGVFLGLHNYQWFQPFTIIWLSSSVACDILIAGTMVYIFYPEGSKSVFSTRSSLLQNLSRLLVETGMITCILTLLEMALFVFCPQNFAYLVPFFMLSIVYSNTVMASLNSRNSIPLPSVAKNSLMLWDNRPPVFGDRKASIGEEKLEVYEDPFKSCPPRPISQNATAVLLSDRPLTAGFLAAQAFGRQDALNMESMDDQRSFMTTYSAPFGVKRSTMWGKRPPPPGSAASVSPATSTELRDDQSFFSVSLYMDSHSPPRSGRFPPSSARSSHFPPLPVRPGHLTATSTRSSHFPPVFLAI